MGLVTVNKDSLNITVSFRYNPLFIAPIPPFWRCIRNTSTNKLGESFWSE